MGLEEPDPVCGERSADAFQRLEDSRKQPSIFAEAA